MRTYSDIFKLNKTTENLAKDVNCQRLRGHSPTSILFSIQRPKFVVTTLGWRTHYFCLWASNTWWPEVKRSWFSIRVCSSNLYRYDRPPLAITALAFAQDQPANYI